MDESLNVAGCGMMDGNGHEVVGTAAIVFIPILLTYSIACISPSGTSHNIGGLRAIFCQNGYHICCAAFQIG